MRKIITCVNKRLKRGAQCRPVGIHGNLSFKLGLPLLVKVNKEVAYIAKARICRTLSNSFPQEFLDLDIDSSGDSVCN